MRIGREICRHLHTLGYKLYIHYNTSAIEAQALAKELQGEIIKADFTKPEDLALLVAEVGQLDLLINNAAIFSSNDNQDPYEQVNYLAPKFLMECLCSRNPKMKVVNLLDMWAENSPAKFSDYSQSKQKLAQYTQEAQSIYPEAQISAIKLGATLFKEGQDPLVFAALQQQYPSSISSLLNEITKLITRNNSFE